MCRRRHIHSLLPAWLCALAILTGLFSVSAGSAAGVGFKALVLDKDTSRPLQVALWYPTSARGPVSLRADSPVFYGDNVVMQAEPVSGQHPLVVLSHGYGGTWRNQSWLAVALAREGYIVAAPNHPGTSALNRDAQQAAALWARPHDLSRTIDAAIADPGLAGEVNRQQIAAVGHSLGGWTVLALAGAMFDTAQFKHACQHYPVLNACHLTSTLGLDNRALETSLQDPRVKAVVALDAGVVRGFTPRSLAVLSLPVLVIGAGQDVGDMPVALESGFLKNNLNAARLTYVEIPDAMHFSFLQRCKPGAAALLESESPGEGILCQDGGGRDREAIHLQVISRVLPFLAKGLTTQIARSEEKK